MADSDTLITVEGYAELRRMIADAPELIAPIAQEAVDNSLRAIYAVIEPYPPETIANSPQNPKGKWYERHYGQRWLRKRSGFNLAASGITQRKEVNVLEGLGIVGGSPTSEQLQLRWKLVGAEKADNEIVGELDNTASYAIPVQGPLELQSGVMKDIGWKSIDDAIAESAEEIDRLWDIFAQNAIDVLSEV